MSKKSSMIKNVLSIFIITLVAVALLAIVNQVTADPIAKAEEAARNEAFKAVFADAESFKDIDMNEDEIAENGDKAIKAAGIEGCSIDDAKAAVKGNETLGYVIQATTKKGYGGEIQIAIGISNDGKLTGFNVIKHSESPGFGANAKEDPAFYTQFKGKNADTIEFVKENAKDNQIDAITGATITTRAVTNAVNSAIAFYNSCLKGV